MFDLYNMTEADIKLSDAVRFYIKTVFDENADDYTEKIVVGVKAFIHVNYRNDPYTPINFYPTEEVKKHWWEFWK